MNGDWRCSYVNIILILAAVKIGLAQLEMSIQFIIIFVSVIDLNHCYSGANVIKDGKNYTVSELNNSSFVKTKNMKRPKRDSAESGLLDATTLTQSRLMVMLKDFFYYLVRQQSIDGHSPYQPMILENLYQINWMRVFFPTPKRADEYKK